MKNIYLIFIVFSFLTGCISETKREAIEKLKPLVIEDKIQSKTFGDTLKVEYEYRGDTVIQNRIDMKGVNDDNFDSSFTVISIWSTKHTSRLSCENKFKLTLDHIDYQFCFQDVLDQLDKDITEAKFKNDLMDAEGLGEIRTDIINYSNGKDIDLEFFGNSYLFDLVREINSELFDNKTKVKIDKINVEDYETNFSKGKNYYFLDRKNDTIAVYNRLEWMS